jgi:hypothetical protein
MIKTLKITSTFPRGGFVCWIIPEYLIKLLNFDRFYTWSWVWNFVAICTVWHIWHKSFFTSFSLWVHVSPVGIIPFLESPPRLYFLRGPLWLWGKKPVHWRLYVQMLMWGQRVQYPAPSPTAPRGSHRCSYCSMMLSNFSCVTCLMVVFSWNKYLLSISCCCRYYVNWGPVVLDCLFNPALQ